MNLEYYKSKGAIYLSKKESYPPLNTDSWQVNGQKLLPTHKSGWWKVEGTEIISVERLGTSVAINLRWELKEWVTETVKNLTPSVISLDESHEDYDDDEQTYSIGKDCPHYGYASFYSRRNDYSIPEFISVQYTATCVGEIEPVLLEFPDTPSFEFYATIYKRDGRKSVNLKNIITYEGINEILVDPLVLHNTPCSVDSAKTYKIIRHHIKDNIDPKVATITSDYDFCLGVEKKVKITPYQHSWEEKNSKGKSYARPRIHYKEIEHKKVKVFEMSPGPKGYTVYPIIEGFQGNTLADLAENIKMFLEELMYHINIPGEECECCKGAGNIFDRDFNLNKR
jgi:hypothetical protein